MPSKRCVECHGPNRTPDFARCEQCRIRYRAQIESYWFRRDFGKDIQYARHIQRKNLRR